MKHIFIVLIFNLFLYGCSSTASNSIANDMKNDIGNVVNGIELLDNSVIGECRTSEYLVGISSIKNQIQGLNGKVESLNLACKEEQAVLKKDITIRDLIIILMAVALAIVGWLFLKK